MNRKIKFRAWDGNRMTFDGFLLSPSGDGYWRSTQYEEEQKQYPYIFMQFTGLKDKNGKEIYEGDIIDEQGVVFLVGRRNDGMGWKLGDLESPYEVEVIGNIYENAELLKS